VLTPHRNACRGPRLAVVGRDASDLPLLGRDGGVRVPGINRVVTVKIASQQEQYRQVFRLLAVSYQAAGYEAPSLQPFRFTPYHALPGTAVFIAEQETGAVATLSLVADNPILGLPMESVYPEEIDCLRQEGRSLVEVTSLADQELGIREFVPVFLTLMQVMVQFGVRQGADTWVITVNPRHRLFYQKMMGFVPIGPTKAYPSVQNHPAEAFAVTVPQLLAHSPVMHKRIVGEELPESVLTHAPMPAELVRYLAEHSSQTDLGTIEEILHAVDLCAARRW